MTTTFEDLATIGIVDKPIEEAPAELIEFLQHYGIEPPENPSDQYLDDINALMAHGGFVAHWGVLGMKWGRRKDRSGKYHETPNRMAGNHPGQGNTMEVSGVVKKEYGRPKIGGPIKTHEGRGTITEVTERKDGSFFVKVDVPDPGKVKGESKAAAPEQPKADRPSQPANQTDSPSQEAKPQQPQKPQKSEYERRNDELAAIIRRIELEQRYAQLTATPKPKLLAATEKVLADAAKKTATDQATKAMGALVNMAVKKAAEAAEKNKKKS